MRSLILLLTTATLSFSAHANEDDNYNVRLNAVTLLFGLVDVGFDLKMADDWTVGPELIYWNLNTLTDGLSQYTINAVGVGARATWHYHGAFTSGFYVAPFVRYLQLRASTTDNNITYTGTATDVLVGGLAGYAWYFRHFNMMLGAGLDVNVGSNTVNVTNSAGGSQSTSTNVAGLAFEYTLGWTF